MSVEYFTVVSKDDRNAASPFTGEAANLIEWFKKRSDVSRFEVWSESEQRHYSVADFLRKHTPLDFSQFVPKFFIENPEEDEMIPNGRYLADGMRVMIANPDVRVRAEDLTKQSPHNTEWFIDRLKINNRWCKVTHVELVDNGLSVSFIGVYDDGTKRQRLLGVTHAWYVKSDSIAEANKASTAIYNDVLSVVSEAMISFIGTVHNTEGTADERAKDAVAKAKEATTRILGLL